LGYVVVLLLKLLIVYSYLVVAISNQKAISLRKERKAGKIESKSLLTFKKKVMSIMKRLDIPLSIYAATEYDEYRKPRTGVWREVLEDHDLDVADELDLDGSFFVGNAAGRQGDHACSDRYEPLNPILDEATTYSETVTSQQTLESPLRLRKNSFSTKPHSLFHEILILRLTSTIEQKMKVCTTSPASTREIEP
jgi:DNA 3'-phosphatase